VAETLFYVLALLALAGAAGVVLAKSPMFSVLSLLASFFALSVIYLLAGFQFMAAVQIVVYAGAILVLFLFVIMLLNLAQLGSGFELSTAAFRGRAAQLGAVVAVALGLVGLISAQRGALPPAAPAEAYEGGIDGLEAIAGMLFGRYGLAFEATGILLLVTMVAVVALAKRQRPNLPGSSDRDQGGPR
jgi:NADH-quinone oxidoreductase subunit J